MKVTTSCLSYFVELVDEQTRCVKEMELIIQISIGVALGIILAWLIIKENLLKYIFNSANSTISLVISIVIFWGSYSLFDLNPASLKPLLFLGGLLIFGFTIELKFPTEKKGLSFLRMFSLMIGAALLLAMFLNYWGSYYM